MLILPLLSWPLLSGALADDFLPQVVVQDRVTDSAPTPTTPEEWIRLIDQRIAQWQRQDVGESGSHPVSTLDDQVDIDAVELAAPDMQSGFDPAVVARGEAAFADSCTLCHDAERSLSQSKSYAGWLATVRRMAAKDDADVSPSDVVPIATYLASLGDDGGGTGSGAAGVAVGSQTTVYGTLSTLWRGSNGQQPLENPGFFVDAWVGAQWQPEGPLSARATACTSCHSDQNVQVGGSGGFTLEVVEALATLDLTEMIHGDTADCEPRLRTSLRAGRFIVPFGAFSQMSHPGRYRTVTNPLMFNMGRRVGPVRPLQPVLPMPYADEGADLHLDLSLPCDWSSTFDFYAVNGLQARAPPLVFNRSRRYVDNNREPALGGRVTFGNKRVRFGGSLMTGNLADEDLPDVFYRVGGVDVTARYDELIRFYFEYAIREDSLFNANNAENYVYGIVAELEARLTEKLAFVARYDTLEHRQVILGDSSAKRFTYGLNIAMPHGSWLMINHEHWMFSDSDDDVIGLRWAASF